MTTREIVETIKQCGQSIIDNAESIAEIISIKLI